MSAPDFTGSDTAEDYRIVASVVWPPDAVDDMLRDQRVRDAAHDLLAALQPFVDAYRKAACPVGDSDLYDEQPRHVGVTLSDCRRAVTALRKAGGRLL